MTCGMRSAATSPGLNLSRFTDQTRLMRLMCALHIGHTQWAAYPRGRVAAILAWLRAS